MTFDHNNFGFFPSDFYREIFNDFSWQNIFKEKSSIELQLDAPVIKKSNVLPTVELIHSKAVQETLLPPKEEQLVIDSSETDDVVFYDLSEEELNNDILYQSSIESLSSIKTKNYSKSSKVAAKNKKKCKLNANRKKSVGLKELQRKLLKKIKSIKNQRKKLANSIVVDTVLSFDKSSQVNLTETKLNNEYFFKKTIHERKNYSSQNFQKSLQSLQEIIESRNDLFLSTENEKKNYSKISTAANINTPRRQNKIKDTKNFFNDHKKNNLKKLPPMHKNHQIMVISQPQGINLKFLSSTD